MEGLEQIIRDVNTILVRQIARNQFHHLIDKMSSTSNAQLKSYYKFMMKKLIEHERNRTMEGNLK